ncbi:putative Apple-like protein [Seiridium unicorne]|uniref:Apple-like protein n=1 Tax=Seiridium unicorne TaxID=138068 RepID=A0ABR2UHV4_9PEZI
MQLQRFLALTASLGLASAKKCGSHPHDESLSASSTTNSAGASNLYSTASSSGTASSAGTASYSGTASSAITSSTSGTASSVSTSSVSGTSSSVSSSATASSDSSSSSVTISSTVSSDSSSSLVTISSTTSSDSTSSTASTTSSLSSTSSAGPTFPQATQLCQVQGTLLTEIAFQFSDSIADNYFKGCKKLCGDTNGCQSFSFQVETGGYCSLYSNPLYTDFSVSNGGSTWYFDLACEQAEIPGPTLTSDSVGFPSETPTAVGAPETFDVYVTPTPVSSDSPDYVPTGAQETPTDDNEFIATYTYTEFELTIAATGSPPLTTGIPHPTGTDLPDLPCMVTPGAQAPFTVLNENFLPLVTRTGSIGPFLQPTEAPAAGDPVLSPQSLTFGTFYLQEVAGETDVYDMVYSDTNQYVAMTIDGSVMLVDASTGPSMVNGAVTTIFSIDCLGIIKVTYSGQNYEWVTSKKSCSFVLSATSANPFKALPVQVVDTTKMMFKDRKRTEELAEELIKKSKLEQRVNADSHAPQCPSTPAGLVAKTKAGYEADQGNFCDDLSDWWGLSPYDFDGSCAVQSLCYDQCSGYSWVGCNAIFGTMMIASCWEEFDGWWEVASAVACTVQASYFTGVAATDTGRKLYYKAQDSMCYCFCSSPPDTCVYEDKNLGFYCADLHSSDGLNCGGCGTQCGANSACHSGVCGCPKDQCGKTCLDLRNNPNNCGKCGNVCDPKYCISGQCYKPNPDECAPDQGVTNGDFSTWKYGFENWTLSAYGDSVLKTDIKFTASSYTTATGQSVPDALGVAMYNLPSGGRHAALQQTNVKMCPGFNYELTFNMGFVNVVNSNSVASTANCRVKWLTGKPDTYDSTGSYQSSDWYSIGSSNPTYATFGYWSFHVAEGQAGVTKKKANLYVDLTAVIDCYEPTNGEAHFIITDIALKPTTQITTTKRDALDAEPFLLESRDSNATDSSSALEPYVPEGGKVHMSYQTAATLKGRRGSL